MQIRLLLGSSRLSTRSLSPKCQVKFSSYLQMLQARDLFQPAVNKTCFNFFYKCSYTWTNFLPFCLLSLGNYFLIQYYCDALWINLDYICKQLKTCFNVLSICGMEHNLVWINTVEYICPLCQPYLLDFNLSVQPPRSLTLSSPWNNLYSKESLLIK